MIGKLRIALYSSTRRTMRFGEAASSARRSGPSKASAANSKVAMYFMVSSSEGNGEDGLDGPPVGGAGEAAADAEGDADLLQLGVDHGVERVGLLLEREHVRRLAHLTAILEAERGLLDDGARRPDLQRQVN